MSSTGTERAHKDACSARRARKTTRSNAISATFDQITRIWYSFKRSGQSRHEDMFELVKLF
jgi:hypothetical protein